MVDDLGVYIQRINISDLDFKKIVGFDNKSKCVTQIISDLPSNIILLQSCYLLKELVNKGGTKVKDVSLLFLMLLEGTNQINEAIQKLGISSNSKYAYLVKCCISEVTNLKKREKIRKEDRLHLTYNAITFIPES